DRDLIGGGDGGGITLAQVLESLGGGERPRGVGHGASCCGLRGRHLFRRMDIGILRYGRPTAVVRSSLGACAPPAAARRARPTTQHVGDEMDQAGRARHPAHPRGVPEVAIIRIDEVTSTPDEAARRLQSGQRTPVALTARHQSRGRGRLGRPFASPAGGSLALTYVHRSRLDPARRGWFPLAAGLAALTALDAVLGPGATGSRATGPDTTGPDATSPGSMGTDITGAARIGLK